MALGFSSWATFHFLYFTPILIHRKQAISMLQILPVWLINRNPRARRIIHKFS
jgi:hypothetical protein